MALFPLLVPDAGEPDYLLLEEASGQGAVKITEVSHGGSVPDLKLINKSPSKLLLVGGEEFAWAKQNRIVNAILPFENEDLRLKCCIPVENLKNNISGKQCSDEKRHHGQITFKNITFYAFHILFRGNFTFPGRWLVWL
jgi:hypothetical protein